MDILDWLEQDANEALYRVDPDFARELGYDPAPQASFSHTAHMIQLAQGVQLGLGGLRDPWGQEQMRGSGLLGQLGAPSYYTPPQQTGFLSALGRLFG